MYKIIKISTLYCNDPIQCLANALTEGYMIVNVSETHSKTIGIIVYVLKKDSNDSN